MRDGFDARHGGQPMMRAARIIGVVVVVLLTAGCGGTKPAPPGEPAQTAAAQVGGGTAATPTPPATTPSPPPPATSPSPPSPSVATQATPAAVESAEHLATPATPAATAQSATKAGAPAAKTPAKSPAPPAAAAQSPKKDVVAQDTGQPKAAPTLDLSSLETRLKETQAIGVMTKLALKNQVDDLLDQFRAFYQGKLKTTLVELRRSFDLLILKVLSLLQDRDPSLAAAIAASREAIWGILSDPVKFANFAST